MFGASIPITSGFRNIGRVGRVLEEEGLPFSSALKFKAFDKPLEAAKDVNDLIKSQRVLEAQAFGNKAGGEVIEEGSDFINREKLSLDAQRILAEFNE